MGETVTGTDLRDDTNEKASFGLDWVFVVEMDTAEIDAPIIALQNDFQTAMVTQIAILVVAVVVIFIASFLLSSYISKPLIKLAAFSDHLAENDLSMDTSEMESERRDEVGRLANSFGVAVDSLRSVLGVTQISAE